ncbi:MAG: S1 RNA-binding domain-containing protein [Litorilinea sp.]
MADADRLNAEADSANGAHDASEAQEAGNAQTAADLELFERYLEEDLDYDMPGRGELREGVIVEIRPGELLVNVGSKRDGVVPQSDLSRLDQEFVKNLTEGQTVDVVVSRQSDDEGVFLLSMSDALQQKDWITAQGLLENGEISKHKVVGYNKGGLTVEFNHLRGFVPASHIVDMPRNLSEDQRRNELESRIGQEMRLKVIEVERRRRRLVMSESLAEREAQAARREELFGTINVGDVIHGEVRSMRPFGAFVDIGGADGLLHVSEIGWGQINHPREVLEVGEKIDVEVIRVDLDNQRIALSRKRLLANPWETVEDRYKADELVPVTITRVVDFGAFAQLEPGIEGLIHISEVADISVAEPLKTIQVGQKVMVKVLRVDGKRQRVGLSLRQAPLDANPELWAAAEAAEATDDSPQVDWVVAEPDTDTDAETDTDTSAADTTVDDSPADNSTADDSPEAAVDTQTSTPDAQADEPVADQDAPAPDAPAPEEDEKREE